MSRRERETTKNPITNVVTKHVAIYIFCFISILLAIYGGSFCTPTTPDTKHRILIIQSFEAENTGYENIENNIHQEFQKMHVDTELRSFYLDCESHLSAEETKRVKNLLDTISYWKPEMILVYDDQATFSLLTCQHPLCKQIPIVFAGVNFPNWPLIKQFPNITGLWDRPEFMKTADMANQLFGSMRIIFWLDTTYLGKQTTRRLLEELNESGIRKLGRNYFSLGKNGSFHFEEDTTNAQNRSVPLEKKPEKTTYIGLSPRETSANNLLWGLSGLARHSVFVQSKRDFSSQRLGLFANNATLTVVNEGFGLGEGLLGGYITPVETQTKMSVQLATKILKGKNIQTIPIIQTPKKYLIDWTEMQRWHIHLSDVPANYQIVNMPYFERYKTYIISFGTLLGIATTLLIIYLILLYQRENRRKQEAQDKQKKGERFLALALSGGKVFAFQLKDDNFSFDTDFYSSSGMIGKNITINEFRYYLHPDDLPLFKQDITDAYEGKLEESIIRMRCKFDCKEFQWWEYRYTYNKEENIFNGLCMNIQKVKEAELELINARMKAEESDKMKSAFLANMSHEIRTPLNAIVGFSNIIGSGELYLEPEEKSEFLKLININCDLLLKLINDILDLSRIESGRMDFTFSACNLSDLFREIHHTHQVLMPSDVTLELEIPENAVTIETDHHRLTQVVTNFINNAAKFTKNGYIKIGYRYIATENTVSLYVEDSGIGIPKEMQKTVFERFNKLDEFAQGTGLGLAICQIIVKRFGGNIQLESEEGKGSCFTINLPVHIINK